MSRCSTTRGDARGKRKGLPDEDTAQRSKQGRCAASWASYEMRFGLRGRAAKDESNDTLK